MGVKAARVQSAVQGDDITFRHTIVDNAVIGNSEGLALVPVQTGDVVKAYYDVIQPIDPLATLNPPLVSVGTVVGSYPSSTFDFSLPGATLAAPNSSILKVGTKQTVRIEITRTGTNKVDTHYLYEEYDVLTRGFPQEPVPPSSLDP